MPTNNEQLDKQPKTPDVRELKSGETTDATRDTGNKLIGSAQESLIRIANKMTKFETGGDKSGIRVLIPLDQSGTRFSIGQDFYNRDFSQEGSFLVLDRHLFESVHSGIWAGIAHRGDGPEADSGIALSSKYGGVRASLRNGLPVLDSAFVRGNLLGTDIALGGSYNPTWKDTLNFVISKKLNIPGADARLSLNASAERRNDDPNIDNRITANLNIYGF